MARKKIADDEVLKFEIKTRVNAKKYKELEDLIGKTMSKDMSSLVRDILHKRPIKVYTHDHSLDMAMEELSALRAEIRAVGVNINQITRHFNTYPERGRKEFYAKIAFSQYIGLETKVEQLLSIITKLSRKWLSE